MTTFPTTPKAKETIAALWRLEKVILNTLNFQEVVTSIVNSMLSELGYLQLGYKIIVLALIDEKHNQLERVAISRTQEAKLALESSPIPFNDILIPLDTYENASIRVINEREPYSTDNMSEVLCPPLKVEDVIPVQEKLGIKTTLVYPIQSKGRVLGVLIFSLDKAEYEVSQEEKDLISSFTDIVGLAVENAKLYSSLQDTTIQLKAANQRLEQLDVLKDEFVSVASHELRTPMTAIKSYLWMALAGKGGDLTEKQKYYLDRAYNSTDRLIKLVNDMLNVSRIDSGRVSIRVEKVNLPPLVEDVFAEVKPRSDELGLTLKMEKPADQLPPVVADVDKIKEILINLIGNSMKFTPKDGTITISFEQKDDTIITHVKDNGRGIAPDDIPKLFQKFGLLRGSYTTNQTTQGTGLGLYICKSIISLHKGEIWGKSEGTNRGSEFSFSLKIYTDALAQQLNKEQQGKEGIDIIHTQI